MKKYEAIETFTDLQDNGHKYLAGDKFPREGLSVSDKRIDELLTSKNRRNRPMIKVVEIVDEPVEVAESVPVEEPVQAPVEEHIEEALSEPEKATEEAEVPKTTSKTTKAKKNTKKG